MASRHTFPDVSVLVCVSDDEERALLTNILSLLGNATVTEATNEEKAFSALSGGRLDMIFLRLGHLEPDPQQVLGKIFATQSGAVLFVFSADGFSCDAFEMQAQTYGLRVAGCFAEPFSLSALAGRIVNFNPQ